MSASRTLPVVRAVAGMLGLLAAGAVMAKPPAELQLNSGARIGVVTVLDAEVTHFHTAPQLTERYLKTYPVDWSVAAMLQEVVQPRLAAMGLIFVPLAPGEALVHAREECFLAANLAKELSKACAALYAQLATAAHVDAIIALGPGLNDSNHADGAQRRELPEYLRGWCMLTDEAYQGTPTLLNLTEMLLISGGAGGTMIAQRSWGGGMTASPASFSAPDLKQLTAAQLAPLQPAFEVLLGSQLQVLLAHVRYGN